MLPSEMLILLGRAEGNPAWRTETVWGKGKEVRIFRKDEKPFKVYYARNKRLGKRMSG